MQVVLELAELELDLVDMTASSIENVRARIPNSTQARCGRILPAKTTRRSCSFTAPGPSLDWQLRQRRQPRQESLAVNTSFSATALTRAPNNGSRTALHATPQGSPTYP